MRPKRNFTWSPELAYIVGLIVTDGCLSGDGRHIMFTSKDLDLIQTFYRLLGLKNKIGRTVNPKSWAYRAQFGDVQFYRWLMQIGLTPNKSKTIGRISVPDEYFIDFLRGHLDGDGSITTFSDHYNTYKNPAYIYQRLVVRFISASKEHVVWLDEKISTITGIKGKIHTTKKNPKTGNVMHMVKFGKKDSLNLLRKIYYSPNLPSLDRKRKQALEYLSSPLLLPKPRKPYTFRNESE